MQKSRLPFEIEIRLALLFSYLQLKPLQSDCNGFAKEEEEEEEDSAAARELIPCRRFEPARWNPIRPKLAYKLAGRPAQLATNAFNQLSQYANGPGHRDR